VGALAVIWSPVSTLRRAAEERRVLLGFGVVALYAALNLIIAAVDVLGGLTTGALNPNDFPGVPPELLESFTRLGVWFVISAVFSPFVGWAVVSLLMQLVTRFFGGTGLLSGMFAVVGIAAVPLVIATAIELPVTLLQAAVGPESTVTTILDLLLLAIVLAAYAWNVALVIIGAAFARRIGYGESAGSCAISCAGCSALILIVVVALGILVAIMLEAVGSVGTT
jgi:Yip1 domain